MGARGAGAAVYPGKQPAAQPGPVLGGPFAAPHPTQPSRKPGARSGEAWVSHEQIPGGSSLPTCPLGSLLKHTEAAWPLQPAPFSSTSMTLVPD